MVIYTKTIYVHHFSPADRSDRDVRHSANCRGRMVRQDTVGRTPGHGQRNGAKSVAQKLHGRQGLLQGIPFQLSPERPSEHRVHVRRGVPDGQFLRVRAGIRAAGRPHVQYIRQRDRRVAQQKRRETGPSVRWSTIGRPVLTKPKT